MIPRTFLGSASDGRIMQVGPGAADDGNAIAFRAQTSDLAPAGAANDCTFDRVYVTLTTSRPVELTATPIVDGVAVREGAFDISRPQPVVPREPWTHEQILMRTDDGQRTALRGRWFALRLDGTSEVEGADTIFDEVVLEYTVESPTRR